MNASTSGFGPLEDPGIKIWRYMDFAKFISMLEYGGLFFPRADKLGDLFEGSWLTPFALSAALIGPLTVGGQTISPFPGRDAYKAFREYVIVSCWHMNEYESDAMWSRYGGTNGSVVIQSTYSLLRDSLPPVFHLGAVSYVTFDKSISEDTPLPPVDNLLEIFSSAASIASSSPIQAVEEYIFAAFGEKLGVPSTQAMVEMLLSPFLRKRKAFQHEQELRAIAFLPEARPEFAAQTETRAGDPIPHSTVPGVWQPLDLSKLIEHVYVAPHARGSFKELVTKVMARYGLEIPVDPTSLDNEPIF